MRLATLAVCFAMCLGVAAGESAPMRHPLFKSALVAPRAITVSGPKLKLRHPTHGIGTAVRYEIVHSQRYVTASKLARGLRALCARGSGGCAIKDQAWTLEDVGFHEHLHPGFIAGASFTESSGGDAACGRNIWGLNSCRGGNFIHGPVPDFRDWRSAFTYFARFVKERWPHATTAYQLPGYSACDSCWGPRTALWMSRLGFSPSLRYP